MEKSKIGQKIATLWWQEKLTEGNGLQEIRSEVLDKLDTDVRDLSQKLKRSGTTGQTRDHWRRTSTPWSEENQKGLSLFIIEDWFKTQALKKEMELMLQDPPDPSKRGARKGRIICSVEGHPEKKPST